MSIPPPEGSEDKSSSELRIRPCDEEEEVEVEVLLIESDDGEEAQQNTGKDNVEVIDVDSDSDVIIVESDEEVNVDKKRLATMKPSSSTDFVLATSPPILLSNLGSLQRLNDVNSNNMQIARSKLTRELKKQACGWLLSCLISNGKKF